MGLIILAMLIGWVVISLGVGFLVTALLRRKDLFPAVKTSFMRLIVAAIFGASPFIYWNLRIYSIGGLWAEECEKRTGYILHASPPLDFVSGPGRISSWSDTNWMALAGTDIRSVVTTDERGQGLTGEDGNFVLRLADADDPRCAPFYKIVNETKRKTPYLQDRCIAIEPLDNNAPVLKVEVKSGESTILHKSGSFQVREIRSALQNAESKEVYAEYVSVEYRHPSVADNPFALFSKFPMCEKVDVLKKNNMESNAFYYAFSARYRKKIEVLNDELY